MSTDVLSHIVQIFLKVIVIEIDTSDCFVLVGLKGKNVNIAAAVCAMFSMVAVCTALVEPQWFKVYGGGCRDGSGKAISYIGLSDFFKPSGHFETVEPKDREGKFNTKYIYRFGDTDESGK